MSRPMHRFTAQPDRRLSSTGSWDRLRRGRPSSRAADRHGKVPQLRPSLLATRMAGLVPAMPCWWPAYLTIDVFVDALDLAKLGFDGVAPLQRAGRRIILPRC